MLERHLEQLAKLEQGIEELDQQLSQRLQAYRAAIERQGAMPRSGRLVR